MGHAPFTGGIMRRRRIAAVSVLGMTLVAGSLFAATASAVTTSSPKTSSCSIPDDNHWPSYVQGRPKGIDPHTTSSIYMWHDSGGWHIRVTHRGSNLRSFSGQLTTGGAFVKAHPVGLEKSDVFQVSNDKHGITFLFKNYGSIDGVDFRTACAPSITFSFQSDGQTSPASKIVIGNDATHPAGNPFDVVRVPVTTTTTTACSVITDDPFPSWVQGRPRRDQPAHDLSTSTCGTTVTAGTSGPPTRTPTRRRSAGSSRRGHVRQGARGAPREERPVPSVEGRPLDLVRVQELRLDRRCRLPHALCAVDHLRIPVRRQDEPGEQHCDREGCGAPADQPVRDRSQLDRADAHVVTNRG